MALQTEGQRRWFFAHLATGMRRIAGRMREAETYAKELRTSPDYQRGMMEGGMRRIGRQMAEAAGVKPKTIGGVTYAANVRPPEPKSRPQVVVEPTVNHWGRPGWFRAVVTDQAGRKTFSEAKKTRKGALGAGKRMLQ